MRHFYEIAFWKDIRNDHLRLFGARGPDTKMGFVGMDEVFVFFASSFHPKMNLATLDMGKSSARQDLDQSFAIEYTFFCFLHHLLII